MQHKGTRGSSRLLFPLVLSDVSFPEEFHLKFSLSKSPFHHPFELKHYKNKRIQDTSEMTSYGLTLCCFWTLLRASLQ